MRTSCRDRSGPALAALCAALVIALIAPSAWALDATYQVLPNATSYAARGGHRRCIELHVCDTDLLGENVPITVTNVSLIAENGTVVDFNWTTQWSAPSAITFPKGNYTVAYVAPLHDNQFRVHSSHPTT